MQSQKTIPVNWARLLESQLITWQGGSLHPKGIAEYITNSDDSYRRLKKFEGEKIIVTIFSRRGKMIDKLIIEDFAEGMSFEDLETKFFQYFDSHSGRDLGEKVTGKFGTGGKAYAIMNFRHSWIVSRKEGKECKAWFKWDSFTKSILYGYDKSGYINKPTELPNGTTIILEDSLQVKSNLEELANLIEKSERIRHVLKNQEVVFIIYRKNNNKSQLQLSYSEPKDEDAEKVWLFEVPDWLSDEDPSLDYLKIKFFHEPLPDEKNIIDVCDGLSSVADYKIKEFENRTFGKHLFGNIVINKLYNSSAIKENRKGLEEGNDLTIEIEEFIAEKIKLVINEIELGQKEKEKVSQQEQANKKLNELSKFLNKQSLNFKLQLSELKKKFTSTDGLSEEPIEEGEKSDVPIFRRPMEDDDQNDLINGRWIVKTGGDSSGGKGIGVFEPDPGGDDLAVKINSKHLHKLQKKEERKGLQVLMSNDENNPESPILSEFEEPVVDRDLETKGVIWINSVHPMIKDTVTGKSKVVFSDVVSNFVLVIIAQYFAQKELELQPEVELEEPLMIFRKYYFRLHRDIRMDTSINFFE